jgi:hypothetical protein
MSRLDDLELSNVSIMKIDVEGYEMEALAGGLQTILKCKPVIILEIWDRPPNQNRNSRIETVKKLGYSVQHLGNDDFLFLPL